MNDDKNNFGIFVEIIDFLRTNNIPFDVSHQWLHNKKVLHIYIYLPWEIGESEEREIGFHSDAAVKWWWSVQRPYGEYDMETVDYAEYQTASEIIEKIKKEYREIKYELFS